ncbi:hypothetical protein EP7_001779 [Isosphaeraceae bacterium EP7]
MGLTSPGSVLSPYGGQIGDPSRLAILVFALVAATAAGEEQTLRRVKEGVAEPPGQHRPWAAPATKLPEFLLDATAHLFEEGVSDPRGCEYRQVGISRDQVERGLIATARGFVLPERVDLPGHFFVGWDGLVHRAVSVGPPIDLDADIRALAESLTMRKKGPESRRPPWLPERPGWSLPTEEGASYSYSGVDDSSPIKLCMLLRLGRSDLAEALLAAGTTWRPGDAAGDRADYGVGEFWQASCWAANAFRISAQAHSQGDDVTALDLVRKLARFRDLATARADAMSVPRVDWRGKPLGPTDPRFQFLGQLDDLLRDQRRRVALPPRIPILERRENQAARITAMISDLDQINVPWHPAGGATRLEDSPLVAALIAEGGPAVAPLLKVLESDDRMTRSYSPGGKFLSTVVYPVFQVAHSALTAILKTSDFDAGRSTPLWNAGHAERTALATSIRQFWEKTNQGSRGR